MQTFINDEDIMNQAEIKFKFIQVEITNLQDHQTNEKFFLLNIDSNPDEEDDYDYDENESDDSNIYNSISDVDEEDDDDKDISANTS